MVNNSLFSEGNVWRTSKVEMEIGDCDKSYMTL